MDSNSPSFNANRAASDGAEEPRKDQLSKLVVQGILDAAAELPLDAIPGFIEEVTNALGQLKQQVGGRAASEIARVEALRAQIESVELVVPNESAPSETPSGVIENAKAIVQRMANDRLEGIRRKDIVAALRMTDVHASQALAYAVKQGWLKLEGQTRGAKYYLADALII